MAQEAYDFARFEARERTAELEQGQGQSLRSVRGGKRNQTKRQRMFGTVTQILFGIAFLALAFALLQSEVQLTEYTQQIQVQQQELIEQQSRYSYLENALNASVNLDQVEKVAKQLGLVKVDESQITYIRIEDEAVLTTAQTTMAHWQEVVQTVWTNLLGYLNP